MRRGQERHNERVTVIIMSTLEERVVFTGKSSFVVDGGEKSGEVQSITVDMVSAADVLLNGEECVTLICDPENISDQIESSSPLTFAGTCRMRIIKPPVVLTKNGMKMIPERLRLRLRKVNQGQAVQEANVTPVRLRFQLRCVAQAAQEPVSLISNAPSPAPQVPPENYQSNVVEEPVAPKTTPTPEAEPTTAPVSEVAPAADTLPCVQTDECLPQTNKEEEEACPSDVISSSESETDSEWESDLESDPDTDPRIDPETGLPWGLDFYWCTKTQKNCRCGKLPVKSLSVRRSAIRKTVAQLQTLFGPEWQAQEADDRDHSQSVEEDIQLAVKTISELAVNTSKRLREVIRIIYDRAVFDSRHAADYADLCHSLKDMKVKSTYTSMTFHKMLLHHCMDEFKKDIKKVMERLCCFNITLFLCELFERNMLTAQDMHECIIELLKNPTDDNLYRFCCLMCHIGKNLNSESPLEEYFQVIQFLMKNNNISSKIIDLLIRVLNVRKRNWPSKKICELQNCVKMQTVEETKL